MNVRYMRVEGARDAADNRKLILIQIIWGKEVKPLLG